MIHYTSHGRYRKRKRKLGKEELRETIQKGKCTNQGDFKRKYVYEKIVQDKDGTNKLKRFTVVCELDLRRGGYKIITTYLKIFKFGKKSKKQITA